MAFNLIGQTAKRDYIYLCGTGGRHGTALRGAGGGFDGRGRDGTGRAGTRVHGRKQGRNSADGCGEGRGFIPTLALSA